jgi:hypothetical protein
MLDIKRTFALVLACWLVSCQGETQSGRETPRSAALEATHVSNREATDAGIFHHAASSTFASDAHGGAPTEGTGETFEAAMPGPVTPVTPEPSGVARWSAANPSFNEAETSTDTTAAVTTATSAETSSSAPTGHSGNVVTVDEETVLLNGSPFIPVGVRTANALMSQEATDELLANLDSFMSYGANTVSVFVMGSRFGDFKAYSAEGDVVEPFKSRLLSILEAADQRQMVVVVGCLYWGGSTAKYDEWSQSDAEIAVASTVHLLSDTGYRNVIIDVDNEGMGPFDDNALIVAAKQADASFVVGTSGRDSVPDSDIMLHFGARAAGKPYLESEGSPAEYWGSWSREQNDDNYRNVGVYEPDMKEEVLESLGSGLGRGEGYLLGSTWLQAVPPLGPNHNPGGLGTAEDPGVLWFLQRLETLVGAYEGTSPPVVPEGEPPLP